MRRILIAAGVIALLATACSPGTPSPAATSGAGGDSSPSPILTESGAGRCPIGTWLFSDAELKKFWAVMQAEVGGSFTPEGSVLVDLNSDNTFVWTYQDYALVMGESGPEVRGTIVGRITGDWSVETRTTRMTNVNDETVFAMTVDGVEVPGADETAAAQIERLPFTEFDYRCSSCDLILDVPTASSRTEITLTPV